MSLFPVDKYMFSSVKVITFLICSHHFGGREKDSKLKDLFATFLFTNILSNIIVALKPKQLI